MSADPRREYEEAFLSGQRARQQNFDPAITVHESTLESMGRKIAELETLNAELLAAGKGMIAALDAGVFVRNISDDHTPDWGIHLFRHLMSRRKLVEAIAKAERQNYYPGS